MWWPSQLGVVPLSVAHSSCQVCIDGGLSVQWCSCYAPVHCALFDLFKVSGSVNLLPATFLHALHSYDHAYQSALVSVQHVAIPVICVQPAAVASSTQLVSASVGGGWRPSYLNEFSTCCSVLCSVIPAKDDVFGRSSPCLRVAASGST
jgi:hypothetical protein